MVNVLFVSQRWFKHDQYNSWLNDAYHDHYSAFHSTGLGQYKYFEYDYQLALGIDVDKSLVEFCKHNKFDVIIFLGYFEKLYKFADTTWNYLKKYPIVFFFGDVYPEALNGRSGDDFTHTKYADLVVHLDTDIHLGEGLKDNPPKMFYPIGSRDKGIFYDPGIERDISILINGTVTPSRRAVIEYINSVGIPIMIRGGKEASQNASIYHYALDYMRSYISICISHNKGHLVGHMLESIECGCLTFVDKSDILSRYFRSDIDYIEFEDKHDLVDKLIYYLDNRDEGKEIVENGKLAVQKYSAYNFYKTLFVNLDNVYTYKLINKGNMN